ncbi:hypothetical protein [Nitrosococcus watsonii]|uniref:Uncharacterized protein n=1 Tax=Nitrosococcus watsoni (strain C-113) TaxID=105559 RepID=D8K7L8_NITWC|nr:hypothetical protein [Nitrosococcus watsonii]ADJ28895.1 conserved hypothetical protein [Nitrosococcus watsonii C-113]ADJ29212.1 conserved hypothetical protein [Nitrosococcus watsonii C-113]ADJ29526.1 conserved hypothetical protein [Nitrosococcus watsonii C-113]
MKHTTLMMSAVVAASMLSTSALALDRANTSEKGSLLVFPKIDVSGERNTIIRLQNDYSDSVSLKCYWKNGTKHFADFQIKLTKFQPIWLSARDGNGTYQVPPFPTATNQRYLDKIGLSGGEHATPSKVSLPENATHTGELQCWAVDSAGASEIRWNHLVGTATVVDASQGTAYEYNAWGFRCLVGDNGEACVVADAGQLDLNGSEYEACPKKLISQFTPAGREMGGFDVQRNELTLASCNQDLTEEQQYHFSFLKFNVWNEQEVKYTGAYQCIDSWHQGLLDEMQNNGRNFSAASLKSDVARFKVKAMKGSVCERADNRKTFNIDESIVTEEAGLLGVMATTYGIGEEVGIAQTGTTLHMLGQMEGFILYDPADGEIEERPAR